MNYEDIPDTESLVFAALNGLDIEDINIPDTEENRNLLRILKAEIKQAQKRGAVINIPI